MSLEIGIIVFGFLALISDIITSRLLTPRLRVFGQRSELYDEERRDGLAANVRVYQFAIQSDESRELEFDNPGAIARLTIRGAGQFLDDPIAAYLGPDDVQREWRKAGKEIVLQIHHIRPHKTWIFRCFVEPEVEEMSLVLEVPSKWPVRRFLMKVSQNIFSYGGPDWDIKRIVVRSQEDRPLTRGFRNDAGERAIRLVGIAIFGAVNYHLLVQGGLKRMGITSVTTLYRWEAPIVGAVVFAVLWYLYSLSQREALPIAQGYQVARRLFPPAGTVQQTVPLAPEAALPPSPPANEQPSSK